MMVPGRPDPSCLAWSLAVGTAILLSCGCNAALSRTPDLVGHASVIDGDTLEIAGRRIRLWGVDAPESRQTCTRGGESYRCGQEAAMVLDRALRDRTAYCQQGGRPDRYGRTVARCEFSPSSGVPREDLGGWLVEHGHALDYPRYSRGYYAPQEALARSRHVGLWAGEFAAPWEWRNS